MFVNYTTSQGSAGSLTHWVGPGIKSASSRLLVGFFNDLATMGTPQCSFKKIFNYNFFPMFCQFLLKNMKFFIFFKFHEFACHPSAGATLICVCVCVSFLGLHPRHTEVPRLGVELELQLLAYPTATALWDLSHVCNLHHSSWQHWILNPLSRPGI